MTVAKAARPHYLPASLIGGFGEPDAGRHAGELRYNWVCMRRRDQSGVIPRIRADNVAIENGLYDVAEPGPDLAADFAEQLWTKYEASLPAAIKALEQGSGSTDAWLTVLLHIQAQSIRHPDFTRAVHEHLGPAAAAALSADDIQLERQRTFESTRDWMARARYAVVRHRVPAQRFLANDKGYVPLHDVLSDLRGVVFPLSGAVAVLMAMESARPGDDYERGPLAERTLNPKGMEIVNAVSWDTVGIKCVIGHPDDRHAIESLVTGEITARMPALGPYRGNREPGLFEWAVPGVCLAIRPARQSRGTCGASWPIRATKQMHRLPERDPSTL